MRLRISISGRFRPSVLPSVPCYFRTTKIAVFEVGKTSNNQRLDNNNDDNNDKWVPTKRSHLMWPRGTCFLIISKEKWATHFTLGKPLYFTLPYIFHSSDSNNKSPLLLVQSKRNCALSSVVSPQKQRRQRKKRHGKRITYENEAGKTVDAGEW